jgi:flagellin
MSIINNVASLSAQRSLSSAGSQMSETMGKLASGTRITSAGDDAAGLAISEKLRGELKGLNQAARNSENGISMIQTAEGALEEVHSMLQRIRELAVQGSNDTLDDTDRAFIKTEMTELRDQINDVASDTEFNGKKLASGALTTSLDAATSTLEVGAIVENGAKTSTAGVTGIDVSGANAGTLFTFADTVTGVTLGDGTNSQSVTDAAMAISSVDGSVTLAFTDLGISVTLASAAIEDGSDIGSALNGLTLQTAAGSGAATFQTGADAGQTIGVSFRNVEIASTNGDARVQTLDTALTAFATSTAVRTEAEAIITAVDQTIEYISETRAEYGAKQNRLESAVANLMQSAENLTSAESRIRDADVASESANLAKAAVLQQAAVSVLSQANQQPQLALKLLS